jgi:hypothetical protein
LATATTQATRRRGAAKPIAARRPARPHSRRSGPSAAARTGKRLGLITLVALGTLVVLGTAALALAAVDPRADAALRRGLKDARNAARDLPSHLPSVSLPSMHSLENVAHQIADTGQRLVGQIRDAARERF